MTHTQKLRSIAKKLQSAQKQLDDLIEEIPETTALKNKIDNLRKQYDRTVWTEAFNINKNES